MVIWFFQNTITLKLKVLKYYTIEVTHLALLTGFLVLSYIMYANVGILEMQIT